ncbi:putative mitochondrial hypothetical protein [Leptomonas pyrrhocoris]|uniref:Uncharacterized protein n=1 Tax=Leptomonas pyrrhocoris TaxID=157538 RepID=A0A0N0DZ38_LEPPY|nr:putative mitochondrial hypothetical protein [Leptomonas pyrrhocoris]XP_015663285.1 putative mitochondrial hypothetical protein [Leptomonas pyrrhocoris]KPA84845.1 putative mitochondrial hypothetical protein [Leptomonas pyrrhocoris]KPA84846.1 putative mitochondrial hypothetical protein [Leptomonas pyrrhocoris]|eukprot:XP_015663284.1 putative mitochondrial hypothetical protein [Leptomonas pyrrhocoris]
MSAALPPSFTRVARQTLQHDLATITKWDPATNKLQCAIRDAGYLVIDLPRFFMYSHSNYGAMQRYIRQSRINKGKINPEDFKDVDTNVLRESLIKYAQTKGPLQKIDFRWFYWMYAIMIVYVGWQGMHLQSLLDARVDRMGASLDQRRDMYDDDYLEEVRPR